MSFLSESYEVVVIGAGHAGCEAALACARMGLETLLLTLNLDGVALFAMGALGQDSGRVESEEWPAKTPFQVDPRRPAVPGRRIRVWQGERLAGAALLGDLTGMQALKAELREQGGYIC